MSSILCPKRRQRSLKSCPKQAKYIKLANWTWYQKEVVQKDN